MPRPSLSRSPPAPRSPRQSSVSNLRPRRVSALAEFQHLRHVATCYLFLECISRLGVIYGSLLRGDIDPAAALE